jgi:hypothetical protein
MKAAGAFNGLPRELRNTMAYDIGAVPFAAYSLGLVACGFFSTVTVGG